MGTVPATTRSPATLEVREPAGVPTNTVRVLLDDTAAGIGYLDRHLRFARCNPALARLCGCAPAAVLGQSLTEMFPDAQDLRAALQTAVADGRRTDFKPLVTAVPGGDGERREVELSLCGDFSDELLKGFVVTAVDVSAYMKALRNVERSEQKLKAAALSADARLQREQAVLFANHEHFLALLGHELRNPLTPILTWTQLLKEEGALDSRMSHAVAVIERNALHQKHLIDNLLDLATLHMGEMAFEFAPVPLQAVLAELIDEIYGEKAHDSQIAFHFECLAPEAKVQGDRRRLTQLFGNLIANALKFTASGGCVTVRLSQSGKFARVDVVDTGIGIAPEFMKQLFRSFCQAHELQSRRRRGLGLGLVLVKHLAERHGGRVEAFSEGEQKGSTFSVLLPLAREIAPSATVLSGAPRGRVLVIEDNDDTREVLRTLLELWGLEVAEASDGKAGIALLDTFTPDLILCDLTMPLLDGWGVARELRGRPQLNHIPLIALTGHGTPADIVRCKQCGFQDHLMKPFEARDLLQLLEKHLPAACKSHVAVER